MNIDDIKRIGEQKELKLQIFQRAETLKVHADKIIKSDLIDYPESMNTIQLAVAQMNELYAEYLPIVNILSTTANGASGIEDTTEITFEFDADPVGLDVSHITIIGATPVNIHGEGLNRTLVISMVEVADGDTISILIQNPIYLNINPNLVDVTVYKALPVVNFLSLNQNGVEGVSSTTELSLTFDAPVADLDFSHIMVTGATVDTVVGAGTSYTITLSSIEVLNGESVTVAISHPSYNIQPTNLSIAIIVV